MNRLKRNPVLAGLAAFVVVSAISLPSALAVNQASEGGGDNDGPVTPRRVVATGTDSQFGRWQLVVSQTASGDLCRGLRLLDANDHPGAPALAEACGGSEVKTHLGSLSDGDGQTLLFGRLPAGTTSLSVAVPGGATVRRQAAADSEGAAYYVGRVTASPAESQALTVTASTPAGALRVDANVE